MDKDNLKILAIDTSCDDTSVAITEGKKVLTNVVSSQIEIHKKSGGVVPMDAARAHEIKIEPLVKIALEKAKCTFEDIDAFAVTYGPGLAPALEVGIKYAKELALKYNKPLIPVNHMAGHIYANWAQNSKGKEGLENSLPDPNSDYYPIIALLVSGGHTEIVYMGDPYMFEILGETQDDACGECFDKVGRLMGLGYPAGPVIEKFAEKGDPKKYDLPRPMSNTDDLNVSYSGLKTASFRLIKTLADKNSDENKDKTKAPPGTEVFKLSKQEVYDVCASFQLAAVETIIKKLDKACEKHYMKGIVLGGGVVKNKLIRKKAREVAERHGLFFHYPPDKLIMDNAAMIGIAAYYQQKYTDKILPSPEQIEHLDRKPTLRLS